MTQPGGPRPVVIVTGRHRPHQVLFVGLSFVLGMAYTVGAPPPQSLAALMPAWLVHVWAIGLLASGVLGGVSLAIADRPERGLWLEAAAMLIGAGALVVALVAIFVFAGWRGLFGAGITAAWAGANLWRAWQIRRDLTAVEYGGGAR